MKEKQPVVIGLVGKMRTGKDTVASLMARDFRGNFFRMAYGDVMKRHYHSLFGYNTGGKERAGYQTFAQACRAIRPSIWVDKLDEDMRTVWAAAPRHIVISDIRQPNEIEHVRSLGGHIIRVTVDDEVRLARMNEKGDNFTTKDLTHETEMYMDDFEVDYVLENNAGLKELVHGLDAILIDIANKEAVKNGRA